MIDRKSLFRRLERSPQEVVLESGFMGKGVVEGGFFVKVGGLPLRGIPWTDRHDGKTVLDIAYDYADAGFRTEAIQLIEMHHANEVAEVSVPNPLSTSQLTHYALAWLKNDFHVSVVKKC